MAQERTAVLSRFSSELGMLLVLLVLCTYFSLATIDRSYPVGADAGVNLAERLLADRQEPPRVLIAVESSDDGRRMARALEERITADGGTVYLTATNPAQAGQALRDIAADGKRLDAVAASHTAAMWSLWDAQLPSFGSPEVVSPPGIYWPRFLTQQNIFNIADQITVIAIIAIGMTMVIITAGIDLSVGSLIALSSVVAGYLISQKAGGVDASAVAMFAAGLAAIAICAGVGLFSGTMITVFDVPPFIVTLAMMWSARGLALWLTDGASIYDLPDSYTWLGRTKLPGGVPLGVALMMVLYVIAHFVMTRTTLGRYIYAVGGNREAARLSGVPVKRVLLLVYTFSAGLAGVGGMVLSSRLKTGDPTLGNMQELYVIAAVVVGGTSLAGGEGRIPGTLIGSLILGVIQNGMNLQQIDAFIQQIVLGQVLLVAVVFDQLKRRQLLPGLGLWRRKT